MFFSGKFYKSWNSSDGSVTTQEWTMDELFSYHMIRWFIIGILVSFLSVIVSGACLLIRLVDYEEGERQPNWVGVFTSLYFLIDCSFGWIVHWFLMLFASQGDMNIMIKANVGTLLANLVVLTIGDRLYDRVEGNKLQMLCYLIFAVGVGYNITGWFI